jgi:hypothetical protein
VALQAEPGRPTRALLRLPPETASPDQPAEA